MITLIIVAIAAAWLVGAVWFAIKGWPVAFCALWPLMLIFYKGPQ